MSANFLNVDLDLRLSSATEADVLISGLQPNMVVLRRDDAAISLELATQPKSADDAISSMADIVRGLSDEASSIWRKADHNRLSIGISASAEQAEVIVSRSILTLVVELKSELSITIYRT